MKCLKCNSEWTSTTTNVKNCPFCGAELFTSSDPFVLAEQGDPESQYKVAQRYEFGDQVRRDYSEAIKWYNASANQGYAPAQSRLGNIYHIGRIVEQNFDVAVKW